MRANAADRQDVIGWLKAGRCPECGFTFPACTCGKLYRIVLNLAAEHCRTCQEVGKHAAQGEKLAMLRGWAKEQGWALRYIMVPDATEKSYDSRCGDALWTGNIAGGE